MEIDYIEIAEEKMLKSLENLEKRFATVRAGRANPSSLDGVMVSYYGVDTPLKQLATVTVPEARQLLIKPFDRSCLKQIEKGIFDADLGFTPNNDGESIRIVIPPLTEERRRDLAKQVKAMSEDAKVAVRNIRRETMEDIEKENLPEDVVKDNQDEIQKLTDKYTGIIDSLVSEKEKEVLTV